MNSRFKEAFVRQRDQSDCGVACLAALIKYYGGAPRIEQLRKLSGTSRKGTTLLGLYQAAEKVGLEGDAFKGNIEHLEKVDAPAILHVLKDGNLLHYVVYFGRHNGKWVIGDPAVGIRYMRKQELKQIWQSGALLLLQPTDDFETSAERKMNQWKWFRKLVREDVNILGVALFLGIVTSILGLAVPVFSKKLIDEILPESHQLKLSVGLGLLLFLLFVRNGVTYVREFFLLRQTKDFNNRIINYFYGSLLHLPKSFFDTRKIGELVARMNDTVRIQNAIRHLTTNVMIDCLMALVIIVFVFLYSFWLGVITFLYLPLYFIIVYFFHHKIVLRQRGVMQSYARTESNYVDTIQGIGTIKASNREGFFSRLTKSIYNLFQQAIYDLGMVRIRFNLFTDLTGTVLMMALLSWGAYQVFHETLELGSFMAIIQVALLLMPAVRRIALTNVQLQEARVAFERMFEFTAMQPEYTDRQQGQASAIKQFETLVVKNMSFRFPGRSQLLKDISFQVQRGEMVALVGESGCGKSTTMQILQKFYEPEEGQLLVNGKSLDDIPHAQWRNMIGVVPQQIKIFNSNLVHNICLDDPADHKDWVVNFCKQTDFHHFFKNFPQQYATILGEEGVNLSGGQQQLVAIARALYQKPRLLLLDEATAAMDRKTEQFVLQLLEKLKSEMGILFVSHRIKIGKAADKVALLAQGEIQQVAAHNDLIKGDSFYAESWKELVH